MPFYVVRVVGGREELLAELIEEETKRNKLEVYSVLQIPSIKGYLIIEAESNLEVQRAIYGLRNVKGVLPSEISLDDILKYLEEDQKIEYVRGDIVEILIGAFKGSRAKVLKYDSKKETVSVELLDTPIPLDIELPVTGVKLIKREKEE